MRWKSEANTRDGCTICSLLSASAIQTNYHYTHTSTNCATDSFLSFALICKCFVEGKQYACVLPPCAVHVCMLVYELVNCTHILLQPPLICFLIVQVFVRCCRAKERETSSVGARVRAFVCVCVKDSDCVYVNGHKKRKKRQEDLSLKFVFYRKCYFYGKVICEWLIWFGRFRNIHQDSTWNRVKHSKTHISVAGL